MALFKKKKRTLRFFIMHPNGKDFDIEITKFLVIPRKGDEIYPQVEFGGINFPILDDISYNKFGMELRFHYLM